MQNFKPVTDDEISGPEKLQRVTALIRDLQADFVHINYLPHERNAAMEQLKVFGRNPENADPIFTRQGIEILTHHSFHSASPTTSKAALQCLANALLAKPDTRQIFVDLGYSEKAVARLKKPKKDDEFLMSRILFLTSYGTSQNFSHLIEKCRLADYVNDNIERHAKIHSKLGTKKSPSTQDDQALSETLKLLFNITYFCRSGVKCFKKSISNIMKILSKRETPSPPLQPPVNYLINALMNLDLEEKKAVDKNSIKACVEKLIEILDLALRTYEDSELDATVSPLLTLLKGIAKVSPTDTRNIMKRSFFPSMKGGDPVCQNSDSLSSRLLAHLTTPVSTSVYDSISALFLELSENDVENFKQVFGMGLSAGFLLTRNLQFPSTPKHSSSIRSFNRSEANSQMTPSRQTSRSGTDFPADTAPNPPRHNAGLRTGRQSKQLMVVFDRLKRTDIVDYDDPIMKAAAKDLVVELDSDSDTS